MHDGDINRIAVWLVERGGAGTLAPSGRESRRNGTSARTSTVQRLRERSVAT
jgi:hypothetical protein